MRQYVEGLLVLFLLSGCSHIPLVKTICAIREEVVKPLCPDPKDALIAPPLKRLPDREKLTYKVSWLGFSIGTITVSINGIKNINGRDAYVLEAYAKSKGLASRIHKIDSRFISYMDVEGLYSVRHEVYRHDSDYTQEAVIDFDQAAHEARYKDLLKNTEKVFPVPENAQDVLSGYYYFMLVPLNVGDQLPCPVFRDTQSYRFFGLVESKVLMRLPVLAKIAQEAFLLYPYSEMKQGKVHKGHTSVYYSCGERRIPLVLVSRAMAFGQVVATLVKKEV